MIQKTFNIEKIKSFSSIRKKVYMANFSTEAPNAVINKITGAMMHIAIIMDGNGRWAENKSLPRTLGHRAGVLAVEECVRSAAHLNVTDLTLYAFSTENWKRPRPEISALFRLFNGYFKNKAHELQKEGVSVRFIGRRDKLSKPVLKTMHDVEALTKDGERLFLNIGIDYGGRDEILRTTNKLVDGVLAGKIIRDEIDENLFKNYTDLSFGRSDPDLIIRTGGEHRLSNFMLWHAAYSEIEFTDVLWPEFDGKHLERSIKRLNKRNRRYGGLNTETEEENSEHSKSA
jgi:undecaprenyl diphosphate synthase